MTSKEHLFKITFLTYAFMVLSAVLLILVFVIYIDGGNRVDRIVKEHTYIDRILKIKSQLTPDSTKLRITTFYSEIIARYGMRYHPKNNSNIQGLNHYQKADIINLIYTGCTELQIDYMLPMGKIIFESAYRPYVETDWETGLWQQRKVYVIQAFYFYNQLPTHLKKKYHFYYNDREDLKDPINATKIELVSLWGLKRMFKGNKVFVYSASHWGIGKIWPIYKKGIDFPEKYVFDKDTIKEDSRNPLMYYYVINSYASRFWEGDVDCWIEENYIKEYKKHISKQENDYINEWKYIKNLLDMLDEKEKKIAEIKQIDLKYQSKVKRLDDIYRQAHKSIMEGDFTDIKLVFGICKRHLKDLAKEILADKKTVLEKVLIIIYLIIFCLFLIFSIIGFLVVIKKIFWRVKNGKIPQDSDEERRQARK